MLVGLLWVEVPPWLRLPIRFTLPLAVKLVAACEYCVPR